MADPNTSRNLTTTTKIIDLNQAITENDKQLIEYGKAYLNKISQQTDLLLNSWQFPLFFSNNVLIRYENYEYYNLNPLAQHLEKIRAEAEAWLIHKLLGYCELSDWEKETFMKRAIGILPSNMEEQFIEILTLSHYQKLNPDSPDYIPLIDAIKKEYGQHTALAFASLMLPSSDKAKELLNYAQKLDLIITKIASVPQIQVAIQNKHLENNFNHDYILIAVLRDNLLKYFPNRIIDDNRFLLSDYLDDYWQLHNKSQQPFQISASNLVFAIIDSIILARFGFEANCVISDNNINLEIILPQRLIYWDCINTGPLSYAQPIIQYRHNYHFLIAQTMCQIANIYVQLSRDINKAIKLYTNAIRIIPDYAENYASLAQIYLKNNNPPNATQMLNKAIELNPQSARYYHMLGLAHYLAKNLSQSITNLKKAIALQPNYIEALNNLGVCYEQTNETTKAIETYQQILNIEPNHFAATFALGNVYFQLKKYERAILYFERALKIDGQSIKSLYNLAQTYYELGEINNSIKTYKKLLKLKADHAPSWYNLGIIYRNQGRNKEAIKCLEQAIRFNPNLMK